MLEDDTSDSVFASSFCTLNLFTYCYRYKGRRLECHAPHVPNQPSEAAAHFYFELAKTVLIKAGGNSSTSIFTQPSASGGHQGPHRNLHLCAFEIGLYALGLHNFVSPNWLSRTYSSHVSWITGEGKLCVCVCFFFNFTYLLHFVCLLFLLQAKPWRSAAPP